MPEGRKRKTREEKKASRKGEKASRKRSGKQPGSHCIFRF